MEKNKKVVEDFLDHIVRDYGYSKFTVRTYRASLDKFLAHIGGKDIKNVKLSVLLDYRKKVSERERISHLTKNLDLAPVRSFFSWLNSKGSNVLYRDGLAGFKNRGGYKEIALPSKEELDKFISPQGDPMMDVLVRLLYSTGLRIGEALSLNVGQAQERFPITGKGGKPRLVVCDTETIEMIRSFENGKRGKLFPTTARTINRKFVERAGKSAITPHTLRHVYATTMLEVGTDIRIVQALLGHATLSMTQRYTHVSDKMLEAAHLNHPFYKKAK